MNILHPLHTDIQPPRQFTYPFCYEPHPLCEIAAKEVQECIGDNPVMKEDADRGKMFGVLVVNYKGNLCFLASYSGLLAGRNDWDYFVPPIVDTTSETSYFKTVERRISDINSDIKSIESSHEYETAKQQLLANEELFAKRLADYKLEMKAAKQRRDNLRSVGKDFDEEALTRESQFMKAQARRMKRSHEEEQAKLKEIIGKLDTKINELKERRKAMSESLQDWLFDNYILLDARGEKRDLVSIFADFIGSRPPSGAGDCCAPKLLQYAFAHGMHPLCMAEFWWGVSPKNEIRHHLHYYPACQSKCKPILSFMLQGLDVEKNPLLTTCNSEIETLYEDDFLSVINKPAGMLSVPGKDGLPSVYSIMREKYPDAEEPMIVHRLDMDTSGLMVVTKTKAVHKAIQRQFLDGMVEKRYEALLSEDITSRIAIGENKTVSLPLAPDISDRPRQIVDRENGKPSTTEVRIAGTKYGKTLVTLTPHTGRTHQLRVHCAHADGLNCPILGDRLYGKASADRLYLNAYYLRFTHPIMQSPIEITKKLF